MLRNSPDIKFKDKEVSNIIIELNTAQQVFEYLNYALEGTIVFLDVDDTLITPQSTSFRVPEGVVNITDGIKSNKTDYPDFEEIIGNWRLQRRVQKVDSDWPALIEKIKTKCPVYGLTKMDTGPFGPIQSVEAWRYEELSKMGFSFSQSERLESRYKLSVQGKNRPVYYKGIFLTGSGTKSQIVHEYLRELAPKKIVLVDDRKAQLEELSLFCKNQKIDFVGIHFRALEHLPRFNNELLALQRSVLIKEKRWMEDEEASALLNGKL